MDIFRFVSNEYRDDYGHDQPADPDARGPISEAEKAARDAECARRGAEMDALYTERRQLAQDFRTLLGNSWVWVSAPQVVHYPNSDKKGEVCWIRAHTEDINYNPHYGAPVIEVQAVSKYYSDLSGWDASISDTKRAQEWGDTVGTIKTLAEAQAFIADPQAWVDAHTPRWEE